MTSSEAIHQLCREANSPENCVGIVTWMHTFSPARMWIAGLRSLSKPLLHLHTQFNQEVIHYAKKTSERLPQGHVYIRSFLTHKKYDNRSNWNRRYGRQ